MYLIILYTIMIILLLESMLRVMYISNIFIFEVLNHYYTSIMCKYYYKHPQPKRLELIKNVTEKIEKFNIVYLKVMQSLCLENNVLNDKEKDYLIKFTDNVPYKYNEIDYETLDILEKEYDIKFDVKEPINSGIVAVVFNATYGPESEKVVVKMIKNGIMDKYKNVYNDIEYICWILKYIPYINNLNLNKIFEDSREMILEQMNFINEANNIKAFREKYENNPEYRIPKVYDEITEKHNNVIVMENIKGLTYNDIKNLSQESKDEFAKLFFKFAMLGIITKGVIHADLHAGNIFFYVNEDNNDLPKYQLGIIDFGICCFPNKTNLNGYYIFLNDIQCKKQYCLLENTMPIIIENKETLKNMEPELKEQLFREMIKCIEEYAGENLDTKYFYLLSKLLKKYKLYFTSEMNKLCVSLNITQSLGFGLSKKLSTLQFEVIESLDAINKILEI